MQLHPRGPTARAPHPIGDAWRDAPGQDGIQPRPSVAGHDQQVGVVLFSEIEDSRHRIAPCDLGRHRYTTGPPPGHDRLQIVYPLLCQVQDRPHGRRQQ